MTASYDAIVVGGGMVGSAIAFGLQRLGLATLMLDEGDVAFRAARGNFGLVWVQTKGIDFPPYARWTWSSAEAWADLDAEIRDLTGTDTGYARPGGIEVCVDAAELEAKEAKLRRLHNHAPHVKYQMLDRRALAAILPGLGPDIAGGAYSPADGHVNPLYLLRGLHAGFRVRGGRVERGAPATAVERRGDAFAVTTAAGEYHGARLVLAAGLGTKALAAQVGLDVPVRPQRGQILVTERLRPFLSMPVSRVRQTVEGTVMLGDSQEDVGFDDRTTGAVAVAIARRAVRVFPFLRRARVVRSWAALRILTPDGYPLYAETPGAPGLFAAVCHSGVTLAAAHVYRLAKAVADGALPEALAPMNSERFAHAPA